MVIDNFDTAPAIIPLRRKGSVARLNLELSLIPSERLAETASSGAGGAGGTTAITQGEISGETGGGLSGGGGGFEPCFPAGTLIETPAGKRAIETFKKDYRVWSFDGEFEISVDRVLRLFRHRAAGYLKVTTTHGIISVTPGHRFFTPQGWVAAADLKAGGEVLRFDRTIAKILSVEEIRKETTVYNLRVEKNQTYFAGGFAVHNRKRDPVESII